MIRDTGDRDPETMLARKPLIGSDTIVVIDDLQAELDGLEDADEDPYRLSGPFWISCAVTWICCLPLGLCAMYSSVTSRESERKGDFLRAEYHRKAALWLSLSALLVGGLVWAMLLTLILLKLNGFTWNS